MCCIALGPNLPFTDHFNCFSWFVCLFDTQFFTDYNSTQNTSLIRELGLNLELWKQTALSRACFNSRQRSLLRRLYQQTFIQAPVVQGIRHRVYFMFLDGVKSLWAWVRILKLGFDKGCFFLLISVFLHMYLLYIFNNKNYI